MGSELVSSYLRSKFSSTLEEAQADPNSPLQIVSRFRSIETLINSSMSSEKNSSSIIPIELLYNLMDALSECRIFAHRRRKEAASKKGFYFFRLYLFEKSMKKRLDEIERQLNNNTITSSSGGLAVIRPTYPNPPDPALIIGFESQTKEIEGLLMTAKCTAIGIVGRCGCGKTALAQKVFASPRIQAEFSPRIWVCLSDMLFDIEGVDLRVRVLNYILGEIGHDVSELEYGDYSVVKLLEKLQRGLMGKRYLIVVDDAWRMDEWYADLGEGDPTTGGESFTHGLPKGSGGAVMVTSRAENVIRRAVGGDKHVIRPHLSHQICWKIFSDEVRNLWKIDPDHHPKLIKLKDDVIADCDGLPLAAKTLAFIIPDLLPEG